MGNKLLFQKLVEYRHKNNLTQQQVCDQLGLKNKSVVGSWEIGKSEPDSETLLKLCHLYGINNLYELIGIEEPTQLSELETDIINGYRKADFIIQYSILNLLGMKNRVSKEDLIKENKFTSEDEK